MNEEFRQEWIIECMAIGKRRYVVDAINALGSITNFIDIGLPITQTHLHELETAIETSDGKKMSKYSFSESTFFLYTEWKKGSQLSFTFSLPYYRIKDLLIAFKNHDEWYIESIRLVNNKMTRDKGKHIADNFRVLRQSSTGYIDLLGALEWILPFSGGVYVGVEPEDWNKEIVSLVLKSEIYPDMFKGFWGRQRFTRFCILVDQFVNVIDRSLL